MRRVYLVADHSAAQAFLTREYLAIAMEYVNGGDMFQYVKARKGLQVLLIPIPPQPPHMLLSLHDLFCSSRPSTHGLELYCQVSLRMSQSTVHIRVWHNPLLPGWELSVNMAVLV